MDISLERVSEGQLISLKNLFVLAAYDLTEFNNADIGEDGLFQVIFNFMDWYTDPNYHMYFIRLDRSLAGFVIVKRIQDEKLYYLNHFFILRKYRAMKIGQQAAFITFDLFKGHWRVSEFDWNIPAQIFWKKVVSRYTSNEFIETRRKDNKGPAQEFTNQVR
ncbi:GNAT family N-acetyltransferase [Paenibacillus sp. Marseille-Q7038]